jgi:DNA-binding response OmpR family regulator
VPAPLIVVIASSPREASALANLTGFASLASSVCVSVNQFKCLLRKVSPGVVIARTNLSDGYSDDVLRLLAKPEPSSGTAVIILAKADFTSKQESRQLALGADCVLKDPLRPDVLLEYVAKFLRSSRQPSELRPSQRFTLAGAEIIPDRRTLQCGKKSINLSPKEVDLARLFAESPGKMVTYETLYTELFGRTFSGDSVNGRVLLGKLAASFQKLRVDLRGQIEVIPKLGFRYLAGPAKERR